MTQCFVTLLSDYAFKFFSISEIQITLQLKIDKVSVWVPGLSALTDPIFGLSLLCSVEGELSPTGFCVRWLPVEPDQWDAMVGDWRVEKRERLGTCPLPLYIEQWLWQQQCLLCGSSFVDKHPWFQLMWTGFETPLAIQP